MKKIFRTNCLIFLSGLWFCLHTTAYAQNPVQRTEAIRPDSTIQQHPIGRAFLFVLPRRTRSGKPFVRYEIVQAPAMSWLVKRSFYWDTDREKPDSIHLIRFRAYTASNEASEILISVTLKS
ncbi:MAG: hypothetical protein JNN12_03460 [Bacteroidetes Order II. Incertae sedis bacterium]|nr:hypothetical protein [Bacteroidetes Order II. bacterium]